MRRVNWSAAMILIAGIVLIELILYLAGFRGNALTAGTLSGGAAWGFGLSMIGVYVRKDRL